MPSLEAQLQAAEAEAERREAALAAAEAAVGIVETAAENPDQLPAHSTAESAGGAVASSNPKREFSIAELLTPWPLGSIPLKIPARPSSKGGISRERSARGGGVYSTRPSISPPDPQSVRRQIMRRSQHPARTSGVPVAALNEVYALQGQRLGCSSAAAPHRRAPTSQGKLAAATSTPPACGLAPQEVPAVLAVQHRPAPGRSAGAMHVLYSAMSSSTGNIAGGGGSGGGGGPISRQWACHPSQEGRGRDLYVGSPPSRRGAGSSEAEAVQDAGGGGGGGSAQAAGGGGGARAPAHRSAPVIRGPRSRRPAWERPLSITPACANQPYPSVVQRHAATGAAGGNSEEEAAAGSGQGVGQQGRYAIAPRQANLSAEEAVKVQPDGKLKIVLKG